MSGRQEAVHVKVVNMAVRKSPKKPPSPPWACSKKFGPLMLFVDLRHEPKRPLTHIVIDDKEFKKQIWEDEFDGHDMRRGKKEALQYAIKLLEDQHRDRPDPDDDLWQCSDEQGKPVSGSDGLSDIGIRQRR